MESNKTKSLETVLNRGVEALYPSKEVVEKRLREEKQTIYYGIDPTGPTLHLGHASNLLKLQELQNLGHAIILLIGDFTAMIGDPTDKEATRVQLSREEVLKNAEHFKEQASRFLDFEGENKAELKYNSEWLGELSFEGVLTLASSFTVQEMLKRDMFRRRLEAEKPIYIHEFLYPLMQGYDSVAMDIDGEVGGNDQTFNMLAGRTLMKKMAGKEKFVITLKLLVDPTGKKMGKTEGNMVTFTDTPEDMYGKIMSWSDELIIPGFELCTREKEEDIENIKNRMEDGDNPKEFKMKLAHAITSLLHSNEAADEAQHAFEETFSEGAIPEDVEVLKKEKGALFADILTDSGYIKSKTQYRRLVDQGAITDLLSDEKITSYEAALGDPVVLKIGKKRFVRIESV